MKRFLLSLLAALALPTAVNAEISDKVHNRCKDAKDYLGCIKAQTSNFNIQEIITNPGTATSLGNACPVGYAYIGKGYCREVLCIDRTMTGYGNDQIIAGKKWRCKNSLLSSYSLLLGSDQSRIGNDFNCPDGEPEIGWTNTCEAPYKEPSKKDRTLGRFK